MEDGFPAPCRLRVLFPGARRAHTVQAPCMYPAKQKPTAATWSRWGKCSRCVRGSRWQIINPLSSRRGIVYFTIALYLKEVLALNLNYTFNTPTRLRKLFGGPYSATRKVITREMGSCSRELQYLLVQSITDCEVWGKSWIFIRDNQKVSLSYGISAIWVPFWATILKLGIIHSLQTADYRGEKTEIWHFFPVHQKVSLLIYKIYINFNSEAVTLGMRHPIWRN